jgi:hypothetical protein
MSDAPFISAGLLEYLKKKFPDKCPPSTCPMDEVRALAGEQRVIAHLEKVFREQDKKAALAEVRPRKE